MTDRLSMPHAESLARIEGAASPIQSDAARAAFTRYAAAFVATENARTAWEQYHRYTPEERAEYERLRASRDDCGLEDFFFDQQRAAETRRSAAFVLLCAEERELARARARYEAETKPRDPHWQWYVTLRRDDDVAVLAGPYGTPEEAADRVEDATRMALELWSEAAFSASGVACGDPAILGNGRLNGSL